MPCHYLLILPKESYICVCFYWLGLVVSIIPITFGLLSLKWGNTSFGFGLWLSSRWFVIARLQFLSEVRSTPWTLEMAQTLQLIMDEKHQTTPCCSYPSYGGEYYQSLRKL